MYVCNICIVFVYFHVATPCAVHVHAGVYVHMYAMCTCDHMTYTYMYRDVCVYTCCMHIYCVSAHVWVFTSHPQAALAIWWRMSCLLKKFQEGHKCTMESSKQRATKTCTCTAVEQGISLDQQSIQSHRLSVYSMGGVSWDKETLDDKLSTYDEKFWWEKILMNWHWEKTDKVIMKL